MATNLARYDNIKYGLKIFNKKNNFYSILRTSRKKNLDLEVKKRIIVGSYVLSKKNFYTYYIKAQKIRKLICNEFYEIFKSTNIILTPISISNSFTLNYTKHNIKLYENDLFTIPSNLSGLPSLSIPIGLSTIGLTIGIQIISKQNNEKLLFKIAGIIESKIKFTFF